MPIRMHAGPVVFTAALLAAAPSVTFGQSGGDVRRFELRLSDGALVAGEKTIRVKRGDVVELDWITNREAVLHLHGYDLELIAQPGKPQAMRFVARATGRFPVEIHGSSGRHRAPIYVEVHPR
jgi:FtsP/CotA-like multicopper oxidase with cupredoxin domain